MNAPILPGATLGLLGGGQLGRMIAVSARQLGYGVIVLAPMGDAPAVGMADRSLRAAFEDTEAARQLADACDVVTYEFENVPGATARIIEARTPCRPDAALLEITQDRILEHDFLHRHGVPTAPGRPVRSVDDLHAGLAALGTPARLKAARGGYDGGGQWRIRGADDVPAAEAVVRGGGTFLLEAEVAFEREVSAIVVRGVDGCTRVFPLFENEHSDGILRLTRCPARVSPRVHARAEEIARTLAEAVGLVGTLTVEMFVQADDVRVNELAPRVHNSGHLTIEACAVSQFEQHLRAVCGLPLAEPTLLRPAAMANLLGEDERRRVRLQGADAVLALPDVHLHLYGKASVRPRRKMGHVTALAESADSAAALALSAVSLLRFS